MKLSIRFRVTIILVGLSALIVACDKDSPNESKEISQEARAFADQHWTYGTPDNFPQFTTYLGYEYWVATTYGTNGNPSTYFKGSDPTKSDVVEWMEKPWTTRMQHLSAGFTHELNYNSDKDQQYYEMIGKYDQFWAGWRSSGNYDESGNPVTPNGSNAQHWTWGAYTDPDGPWIHNTYRDTYNSMLP